MSRIKIESCELVTAQQVLVNPQNSSTSKQQFSFSKAQRFNCKTQLNDYNYYNLPSTKTHIAALIGSSKRNNFQQKDDDCPSPNKYLYSIDGQFQNRGCSTKRKTKGCYFGLGRGDIKVNNFLGRLEDGPSAIYNPQFSTLTAKKQFSFTRSKKFQSNNKIQVSNIGPGSYKIDTSLQQGKQFLSTQFKNLCPKIQQVKVQIRKKRISTEPPLYWPVITSKGEQLNLRNSHRGVMIGRSKRSINTTSDQIPGPGQYKVFSEFPSKGKS